MNVFNLNFFTSVMYPIRGFKKGFSLVGLTLAHIFTPTENVLIICTSLFFKGNFNIFLTANQKCQKPETRKSGYSMLVWFCITVFYEVDLRTNESQPPSTMARFLRQSLLKRNTENEYISLETSLICILLLASCDVHFDKRMICFLNDLL